MKSKEKPTEKMKGITAPENTDAEGAAEQKNKAPEAATAEPEENQLPAAATENAPAEIEALKDEIRELKEARDAALQRAADLEKRADKEHEEAYLKGRNDAIEGIWPEMNALPDNEETQAIERIFRRRPSVWKDR